MKKTYQMFWDCAHCGTKKLLGISHRHCPNCGAAQDENKRYFPPDGEEVELHNHIYYGVDWDCQYCSTPNSKNSNNCVNCGGPKEGTFDVDLVGEAKKPKVKNTSNNDTTTNSVQKVQKPVESISNTYQSSSQESSGNGMKIVMGLMGIIFVFLIGFLIYGHMKITDHTITVAEKTWSRSIDIEEYRRVSDTDWCSSMPSDAYNVKSFRDVRSHRQVADGQTCHTEKKDRGDGSYTSERVCQTKYRREPVYDNRCNYMVNRWRFSNKELSSGTGSSKPYDPDVSKYKSVGNILGSKRVAGRNENYTVSFRYQDDGKSVSENCYYSQNTWSLFNINGQHQGKVRMIGGLICSEVS